MCHYRRIFNITNADKYLLFSVDFIPDGHIRLVKNNKLVAVFKEGEYFVYFLKEYLKLYRDQTRILFYSKSDNSEAELKNFFKKLGDYSYQIYKKYRNRVEIIAIQIRLE